jgi:hypothetical protein
MVGIVQAAVVVRKIFGERDVQNPAVQALHLFEPMECSFRSFVVVNYELVLSYYGYKIVVINRRVR